MNEIKKYYLHIKSQGLISQEDIIKNNITNLFWIGIIGSIQNGEIINISIRGKTGTSKSTTGTKILWVLLNELRKVRPELQKLNAEEWQNYLYTRISSDQTEFLRFAMKEKGHTVALIDEFSSLGTTGLNSTTEEAMYNEHSDLFAQEFIHKISCSPAYINDKNADIILDVIAVNKEEGITELRLLYRDVIDRIPYPLGIIKINVKDIIKQPFYERYRKKKFARLDLLKKYGIRNRRELEFSEITLNTYMKLKDIAIFKKQNEDIILGMADQTRREMKLQYSLLSLNFVVIQTKALLGLVTETEKLIEIRRKLIIKKETTQNNLMIERIEKTIQMYAETLKTRIDEEKTKVKILREYENIKWGRIKMKENPFDKEPILADGTMKIDKGTKIFIITLITIMAISLIAIITFIILITTGKWWKKWKK